MIVNVHMLANQPEYKIRCVEIPPPPFKVDGGNVERILENVFHCGQNEFQPVAGICSVSVGDVIEYNSKNYLILPAGFYVLTTCELITYVNLPQPERSFYCYSLTPNNLS
jgi:hypothetical protein